MDNKDQYIITKTTCPVCNEEFPNTKGNKLFQIYDCPVCGHQWMQIIRIDHERIGEPKWWGRIKVENQNLHQYNIHLLMDLRLTAEFFSKRYRVGADYCGIDDCTEMIDSSDLLLRQCLEDGWPANRLVIDKSAEKTLPYMCENHFSAWLKKKYSSK